MDNQLVQEDLFDVEVDSIAKKLILDIATWAKIVSISAITSYGLSLVISIFRNKVSDGGFAESTGQATTTAGAFVTLIIGIILNSFLFTFARNAKYGVEHMDQGSLENGFNKLHIYFKIVGVIVIIFISVVVLLLLFNQGI